MRFKFNFPLAEYVQVMKPLTGEILNIPGLRWKIWLVNEVECVAGGIYLFDDASFVQQFLFSSLMDGFQRHPGFTSLEVMPFDVLKPETALTHGPIGKGVRV